MVSAFQSHWGQIMDQLNAHKSGPQKSDKNRENQQESVDSGWFFGKGGHFRCLLSRSRNTVKNKKIYFAILTFALSTLNSGVHNSEPIAGVSIAHELILSSAFKGIEETGMLRWHRYRLPCYPEESSQETGICRTQAGSTSRIASIKPPRSS